MAAVSKAAPVPSMNPSMVCLRAAPALADTVEKQITIRTMVIVVNIFFSFGNFQLEGLGLAAIVGVIMNLILNNKSIFRS